ncbi:MAG: hypothetical protein WKF53_16535 [Rubrobacter sp.]
MSERSLSSGPPALWLAHLLLLAVIAGGEVAGFAGVVFAVLPQLGEGRY